MDEKSDWGSRAEDRSGGLVHTKRWGLCWGVLVLLENLNRRREMRASCALDWVKETFDWWRLRAIEMAFGGIIH